MTCRPCALLLSHTAEVIEAVQETLAVCNLPVTVCRDPKQACEQLAKERYSVLLLHLAGGEDEQQILPVLWALTSTRQACAALVLGSQFTEEQIASLLRVGAADCLCLPDDLSRLAEVLDELLSLTAPEAPVEVSPQPRFTEEDPFDAFTPALESLMGQVRRVAPQDTTLLLTGETGTGKTRLARLIHEMSPRRDEPFLVVDCGSLSATLIESELFGHAKGAFTGADRERPGKLAAAGAGTLLLDEVNSLPLPLQGKLLRAVDERVYAPVGSEKTLPVRARLIAATNVPLEREVNAGRFRSDLFYRLDVVGFHLPPLRERRGCILPLADRFLAEFAASNRPDLQGFTKSAQVLLQEYDWPGNIRELRNSVIRAAALAAGPEIDVEDLPATVQQKVSSPVSASEDASLHSQLSPAPLSEPATLALSKQELEIRRILETLEKHGNNRLRAAEELGISRVALYKKLHKYGLMTPRYQKKEELDQC